MEAIEISKYIFNKYHGLTDRRSVSYYLYLINIAYLMKNKFDLLTIKFLSTNEGPILEQLDLSMKCENLFVLSDDLKTIIDKSMDYLITLTSNELQDLCQMDLAWNNELTGQKYYVSDYLDSYESCEFWKYYLSEIGLAN